MAQLPGERFLIQQIGSDVVLFERNTEEEIVRFNVSDHDAVAKAQEQIHRSAALSEEERCFAHFWSGYFYAYSNRSES